ncbi:DUF2470 domain-containing protein [Streptomyces sp. VB1]|uniref:DUF2470 domain-containing protein n=1 Tax=Streptomyces sp. VB1 TaxID=2986803 RepID=UPI002241B110|nr:DUF2470 domain-containing protein [Streptomyces sp. VB1]UZI34009.1 DUF2470 domain-containing protein [Streptomyces sp. VB1]
MTAAERLQSMLVAASSLTLRTPGHEAELVGRHRVLDGGRVRVELPADQCMTRHLVCDGRQLAMIEVTDLVPVSVRNRIRSRAALVGSLAPAGAGTGDGELFADFVAANAEVTTGGQSLTVGPDTLAAAHADPFAAVEARLLCHLAERQRHVIEQLTRLAACGQRHGVRAVQPVRLDRFGIVLRLESPEADLDVRLDFPTPADDLEQVNACLDALLARARDGR